MKKSQQQTTANRTVNHQFENAGVQVVNGRFQREGKTVACPTGTMTGKKYKKMTKRLGIPKPWKCVIGS